MYIGFTFAWHWPRHTVTYAVIYVGLSRNVAACRVSARGVSRDDCHGKVHGKLNFITCGPCRSFPGMHIS